MITFSGIAPQVCSECIRIARERDLRLRYELVMEERTGISLQSVLLLPSIKLCDYGSRFVTKRSTKRLFNGCRRYYFCCLALNSSIFLAIESQSGLCMCQCATWHSLEQYVTLRHRLQYFVLLRSTRLSGILHCLL